MAVEFSSPSIHCLPYSENPSLFLAKKIINDFNGQLPRLDNIVILMPNYHASAKLREHLSRIARSNGYDALLAPQIFTLKDYIEKNTLTNHQRIPANSRELFLIQALEENQNLFGNQNLLTVAEALLSLFDELTRYHTSLPKNLDTFIQQLEKAYCLSNTTINTLSQEANIIHTLWTAWHTQLSAEKVVDLETYYQLKLSINSNKKNNTYFYMAGYYSLLPSELMWVKEQISAKKISLLFHGPTENSELQPSTILQRILSDLDIKPTYIEDKHGSSNYLDTLFQSENIPFYNRANKIKQTYSRSPIKNDISTFRASTFENEAKAITLQIRAWMSSGKKHIGLVVEDRMLARRVRAFLDHEGIGLKDMEGWALSTSAAAAILESWLQCIEENFHHQPLLDVIKSPFSFSDFDLHPETIYRFETDIVIHENISNDLNRYQKAITRRLHRLNIKDSETAQRINDLLEHVRISASPLQTLLNGKHKLSHFLSSLALSIQRLGCWGPLQQDNAGHTIISLIEELQQSVKIRDIDFDWVSFRHWLGKKFESTTFKPDTPQTHYIELLHLTQSTLGHYDALIIAGLTQSNFPGAPEQTPFFNQTVKQELGLPTSTNTLQEKLYHFRRLLQAAPHILLTMHTGAQENLPSNWLSLLENFHQLAFHQSLENEDIAHWLRATNVNNSEETVHSRAAITVPYSDVPKKLSASSHQTLINCPFAFFGSNILKLQATEEIREILAKSDYGERVHTCLFAFHNGGVKNLPGPFSEPLSKNTRQNAIDFLIKISLKVFELDIEDNFQHRGWQKRWLNQIPSYIDWQIERESEWRYYKGEYTESKKLKNGVEVHGRIDRADVKTDGKEIGIIDYKTGTTSKLVEIELGESVQLTHYAIASNQPISQVEYVLLEDPSKKQVISKCKITLPDLASLKEEAENRLHEIYQQINNGEPLVAWGTDSVCQYCNYRGVCRKEFSG